IGTQRPGAVAPKAKPLPLPPAARPKPPEGAPLERPAALAPPVERPHMAPTTAESLPEAAPVAQLAAYSSDMDAAKAGEIQAAVAAPPRVAVPSREKVEMPNLRQMSAELEQEVADALGDMSLEEMVKAEAAAPAATSVEGGASVRARIV